MLDAYIIERIRREREQERRDGSFVPLRIEVPREPAPKPEDDERERDERGSSIVDYRL